MGAKVICSDGFCGDVKRTILDPAARTVTHLVVGPGHSTSEERLVPVELADERDGKIIFRDSQHMTATFAESLSGELGRQLNLEDPAGEPAYTK